jgi:predicted nucleic acid-binding protein
VTRFLDASALAKRYLKEGGSAAVNAAVETGIVVVSRLSYVEVCSAIARRVREGAITAPVAQELGDLVHDDFDRLNVVELSADVAELARQLLARRVLRASDAVQLASALHYEGASHRAIELVCFDESLSDAARREGLVVTRLGA